MAFPTEARYKFRIFKKLGLLSPEQFKLSTVQYNCWFIEITHLYLYVLNWEIKMSSLVNKVKTDEQLIMIIKNISHDIAVPLSAILADIELVRRLSDANIVDSVKRITNSAKSLSAVLHQVSGTLFDDQTSEHIILSK